MKSLGRLLLVTLVRGALFLAPIVLVAVLAREGYGILRRLAQPVARLLPQDRLLGLLIEDLISIAAILIVFMIAGLIVTTRSGQRLSDRMERNVLYRVPGYLLVRGAMGNFPGLKPEQPPVPALLETGEGWAFALLIEKGPPGYCTVFLPDSPTPTSGCVRIIEEERVRVLNAPMLAVLASLTRSGTGSGPLAAGILGEAARGAAASEKPNASARGSLE